MCPRRLCTWLCHCDHCILAEIAFLTYGPRLLPPRAVSARTAFWPLVRILGLLLGLTQSGNTGSATLNTCCLNAQVSRAWEAHWWLTFFWDDLFRACSGSDHATALFPSDRTPVMAAPACLVPFLLDPAAALGCQPPWHMKLQCVNVNVNVNNLLAISRSDINVWLFSRHSCWVCRLRRTRLPPSASVLASLRLPAWSSVHS